MRARWLVFSPIAACFVGGVFACGGDVDPVQFADDAGRARRDSGAATPDAADEDSGMLLSDGGADAAKEASNMCPDPTDLGGLDSPRILPAITDNDATPPHSVEGLLSSAKDVDAYTFFAEDTTGHLVGLTAKINVADAEICIYVKCKNGQPTDVSACTKGTKSMDTIAGQGCCGPSEVAPTYNCPNSTDESVNVELQVKAIAPICTAYKVEYNM